MPRDPLDGLLRLRRLSLEEAMRALAAHLAAEAAADEALARIEASIATEEAAASRLDADDLAVEAFGRWLRRTIQEREAATAARDRTEADTGRARAVLGAARAAVAAVEAEIARRAEADRIAGLRREQAVIDEHAGRRRD
jgi:flagellar protein FliJ